MLRDDARAVEATHKGHERVSTIVVDRDGQQTSAACYGPELSMAMCVAAWKIRRELERDECKAGGPHFFERIDPRDEAFLGVSGMRCVECGCAPREREL